MRTCIVWCCQTKGYHTEEIQYFRVTKARISAWSRALRKAPEDLTNSSFVCSRHFAPDDFDEKNGKKLLKKSAIPSLMLTPSSFNTSQQVFCVKGNYRVVSIPNKENILPVKEDPLQNIPSTSGISRCSLSSKSFLELGILDQVPTKPCAAEESPERGSSSDSSVVEKKRQSDNQKKRKIQVTSSDSEGLRGSSKKQRVLLRTYHNYCKSPRKLSRSVEVLKKQTTHWRQTFRNEQRKVRRLRKKLSNLYQIVKRLKKVQLVSTNAAEVLEKCCSGILLLQKLQK